jgi:hypothetical protein
MMHCRFISYWYVPKWPPKRPLLASLFVSRSFNYQMFTWLLIYQIFSSIVDDIYILSIWKIYIYHLLLDIQIFNSNYRGFYATFQMSWLINLKISCWPRYLLCFITLSKGMKTFNVLIDFPYIQHFSWKIFVPRHLSFISSPSNRRC